MLRARVSTPYHHTLLLTPPSMTMLTKVVDVVQQRFGSVLGSVRPENSQTVPIPNWNPTLLVAGTNPKPVNESTFRAGTLVAVVELG